MVAEVAPIRRLPKFDVRELCEEVQSCTHPDQRAIMGRPSEVYDMPKNVSLVLTEQTEQTQVASTIR